MSAIAIVATLNGIIVHMIMIARVIYGLADQGSLPKVLTRLNPVTHTPLLARRSASARSSCLRLPFRSQA